MKTKSFDFIFNQTFHSCIQQNLVIYEMITSACQVCFELFSSVSFPFIRIKFKTMKNRISMLMQIKFILLPNANIFNIQRFIGLPFAVQIVKQVLWQLTNRLWSETSSSHHLRRDLIVSLQASFAITNVFTFKESCLKLVIMLHIESGFWRFPTNKLYMQIEVWRK